MDEWHQNVAGRQWEEGQTEPPPAEDDSAAHDDYEEEGEAPNGQPETEEPEVEEEANAEHEEEGGQEEEEEAPPPPKANVNAGMFAVDHEAERLKEKQKSKKRGSVGGKKKEEKGAKPSTVPQENRLYEQAKRAERRLSERREKVPIYLSVCLSID